MLTRRCHCVVYFVKYVFVETTWFTRSLPGFFLSDQDYADFQEYLSDQPDKGDVVEGSGGLRKLRWADKKRRKGKRGGCRVLYLHVPDYARILLVEVYGKNEQDNFSADDLKEFKKLVQQYKDVLSEKRR